MYNLVNDFKGNEYANLTYAGSVSAFNGWLIDDEFTFAIADAQKKG